jgi:hypothetical protein
MAGIPKAMDLQNVFGPAKMDLDGGSPAMAGLPAELRACGLAGLRACGLAGLRACGLRGLGLGFFCRLAGLRLVNSFFLD